MIVSSRNSSRPLRAAFTLVEVITTIVILATALTVASRILLSATAGYTAAVTRTELHVQLSTAMDRIVTDLRQARVIPSYTPVSPDITTVTASSIQWTIVGGGTRTVSLSGSQVLLTTESISNIVLADNVTTFGIQCYNESNAAMSASLSGSATDPVRRVQITITATSAGVAETIRTRVFLRASMSGAG